jgi:hypothetical protein
MHQKYIILFLKVSYMFRPCGSSSGRTILIDYVCVYTVKCECALDFIPRLRGVATAVDRVRDYINATIVYKYYST